MASLPHSGQRACLGTALATRPSLTCASRSPVPRAASATKSASFAWRSINRGRWTGTKVGSIIGLMITSQPISASRNFVSPSAEDFRMPARKAWSRPKFSASIFAARTRVLEHRSAAKPQAPARICGRRGGKVYGSSVRFILGGAWLLCGACGGQSQLDSNNANLGGTAAETGGTAGSDATGGAGPEASGGAGVAGTGGSIAIATGGSVAVATGGSGFAGTGGNAAVATGGFWVTAGTGGAGGSGGLATTGGAPPCSTVVCPSIPSSCKKIIQDPGACCPTCTDTGCDACAPVTCATGKHAETAAGACCPTCVDDPPDACTVGQQNYASIRASMIDKYSSSGCKNSADCVLVPENNLCAWNCDIALPSLMSNSLVSNLTQSAQSGCATCPTPTAPLCEPMLAACVNSQCVAVNSS